MKSDAKLFFVRFGASSTLKLERPRQFIMPGRSIRLSDALHETGTLKWNMMGSCLASNLKPLMLFRQYNNRRQPLTLFNDYL